MFLLIAKYLLVKTIIFVKNNADNDPNSVRSTQTRISLYGSNVYLQNKIVQLYFT